MPTSPYAHLYTYMEFLQTLRPTSILDIGIGNGKLGFIARDLLDVMLGKRYKKADWRIRIDGIEIFEEYIQDHQKALYDHIYIGDAFKVIDELGTYDLVVLGDVLEHFPKHKGWQMLDKCFAHTKHAAFLFIPLGKGWQQEAIYDNPFEQHLASWTLEELEQASSNHQIFHYKVGPYGAFFIKKPDYINNRIEFLKTESFFPANPEDTNGIRSRYHLSREQIDEIDLKHLARYAADIKYRHFFLDTRFKEHYRLLAYLSTLFQDAVIFDIGTFKGYSALALAYNRSNRIVSYDIDDCKDLINWDQVNANAIEFNIGNALDDQRLLHAPVILLDTDHDGIFEAEVYAYLRNNGYKGLLVVDDIYLNPEMTNFWRCIDLPKEDLTDLGHWSGTGLVDFSKRP